MTRPQPTIGLRHLALNVLNLEACEQFYVNIIGMTVEWRPDPDNIYLTSGHDNLALHRAPEGFNPEGSQRLDHLGFIINTIDQVDVWHDYFKAHNIKIAAAPKTHRDGARSFYGFDPDGNVVQMIYHPPLAR